MTVPVVESGHTTGSGSSASVSVNAPTGTVDGSLLLAIVASNGYGARSNFAPCVALGVNGSGSSAIYVNAFAWHQAGSAPASYSFNFVDSANVAIHCMRITGADPVAPIPHVSHQTFTENDQSGAATQTATGVTTTHADTLLITAYAQYAAAVRTYTAGSSQTEIADNGSNIVSLQTCKLTVASPGATGNKDSTPSASSGATQCSLAIPVLPMDAKTVLGATIGTVVRVAGV